MYLFSAAVARIFLGHFLVGSPFGFLWRGGDRKIYICMYIYIYIYIYIYVYIYIYTYMGVRGQEAIVRCAV